MYLCENNTRQMYTENDFKGKLIETSFELKNYTFIHSAPSNIALVKYWGKKEHQIPANPSLSLTLNACKTVTKIVATPKEDTQSFSFDFYFEGEQKPSFLPKIQKFLERIEIYQPFLKQFHFEIHSHNTFPHSSGIASSASAMAAMAANFVELEKTFSPEKDMNFWNSKVSFLARLGSGSACRSIKGSLVAWGKHTALKDSSDLYGIEVKNNIHSIFKSYQDTILLVDKGEKQVSSTVGHDLMHQHPFALQRFQQAHDNLSSLIIAMKEGNLENFIKIVESEALTLHAMMMTSHPYFILMKPNTLEIIQRIWRFRNETGIPVCFTLDAGANVHVLYPDKDKPKVLEFIQNELIAFCQNQQYICDTIGEGIEALNAYIYSE